MDKDLIAQLHNEWRAFVQALHARMKPILQAQNLTRVDGIVMMTIKKAKCPTKAELAERLLFEPASLTRSLNRLADHGLIHRYTDPADKRFTRLELTTAGEKLTQILEKNMLSIWKTAFHNTTNQELTFFTQLLSQAKHNLTKS